MQSTLQTQCCPTADCSKSFPLRFIPTRNVFRAARKPCLGHSSSALSANAAQRNGSTASLRTYSSLRSATAVCQAAALQGPDALLFDCDGVLVDTEADGHRVAFNKAFKQKGTALLKAVTRHSTADNRQLDATSETKSQERIGLVAQLFARSATAINYSVVIETLRAWGYCFHPSLILNISSDHDMNEIIGKAIGVAKQQSFHDHFASIIDEHLACRFGHRVGY